MTCPGSRRGPFGRLTTVARMAQARFEELVRHKRLPRRVAVRGLPALQAARDRTSGGNRRGKRTMGLIVSLGGTRRAITFFCLQEERELRQLLPNIL